MPKPPTPAPLPRRAVLPPGPAPVPRAGLKPPPRPAAVKVPARDVNFVRGILLKFYGTIIAAPFEQKSGGWMCVVVGGNDPKYKVGSFHVFVTDQDILDAEQVHLS